MSTQSALEESKLMCRKKTSCNGDFYSFYTNIYETLNFFTKMTFIHFWLKGDLILNNWWFQKRIIVFMQLHCIVY